MAAEAKGARQRRAAGAAQVSAGLAEESGRRQEVTVAVEKLGSLAVLCFPEWPPVSRSEPRTGETASFIYPPFSRGAGLKLRLKGGL